MRILIVSQYFPPEPFRVGDLAVALTELGHDVWVLTGYPNYPTGRLYDGFRMRLYQREDYHGVTVIRVPLFVDKSYSKARRTLNYLSYAVMASLLGPILVGAPDCVLVYQLSPVTIGIPGLVMKAIKRVPIAFWVFDLWPESLVDTGLVNNKLIIRWITGLAAFLYRHSDRILVQSRGFIPSVLNTHPVPEKVEYLPNFAEDLYRVTERNEVLAEKEGMAGAFNVVFAGNMGPGQGLDVVLDAAERLREYSDIQIVLLGDGGLYDQLKADAVRRELTNVQFKGRRPVNEMPAFFALADVMLVTLRQSGGIGQTIPGKIQSYMASGRPIIACLDGEGARVVEEAQAGITCLPGDSGALAAAVLRMYRLPLTERHTMGLSGRQYYEQNFDRTVIASRLEKVLQSLRPNFKN